MNLNCYDNNIIYSNPSLRSDIWKYFRDICSANLHIVLCVTPLGESLRNHCRKYPGLIGNMAIDWIRRWSDQTLFSVANLFLLEHPSIPEDHLDSITNHFVHVHQSLQFYSVQLERNIGMRNLTSPTHYLEFIRTYLKLIEEKNNFIVGQCNQLADAIGKIDEATEQVDQLNISVGQQRLHVHSVSEKCDQIKAGIQKCNLR